MRARTVLEVVTPPPRPTKPRLERSKIATSWPAFANATAVAALLRSSSGTGFGAKALLLKRLEAMTEEDAAALRQRVARHLTRLEGILLD